MRYERPKMKRENNKYLFSRGTGSSDILPKRMARIDGTIRTIAILVYLLISPRLRFLGQLAVPYLSRLINKCNERESTNIWVQKIKRINKMRFVR